MNKQYSQESCMSQQQYIMSGQEYTKKIQSCRKELKALKKDISYRTQMVGKNEPTYAIDAEIRGQFVSIDQELSQLYLMMANYEKKAKDLGLTPKEIQKRKQAYTFNMEQKQALRRMYDQSLAIKIPGSNAAKAAENMTNFNEQYKGKTQTKDDHIKLKKQLQKNQDDRIDDLLGVVGQIKNGQKGIGVQLKEQDKMLDRLQDGIDGNMQQMSKVRRNLGKLMQSSSYTCLVLIILLLIAGIICNLILWPKK